MSAGILIKTASGLVPAATVPGLPGSQGPTGPEGPPGSTAAAGLSVLTRVRAGITADMNWANQTLNTLGWDDELEDPDGFHDNAINNNRFTVPTGKAGLYYLSWAIDLANATSAALVVYKNGNAIYDAGLFGVIPIDLAVNDYLHVGIWASNNGSQMVISKVGGSQGRGTHIELVRVGA